jgi:hypothetical protein
MARTFSSSPTVRFQQRLALGGAQLRKLRIAAGDQAFARIVRMRELKEVTLVKQPQLQPALLDQRANLRALERRDPGDPRERLELLDAFVRDHPPIAHHHHTLDAKVGSQALNLRHERGAIAGGTIEYRHRDRTTATHSSGLRWPQR